MSEKQMVEKQMGSEQKDTHTSVKIPEKEFPVLPDGTRDYLQVDPVIGGQNFVCVSFISPEAMIKKRDLYYFNQFLYREVNKTLKDQAVHMAKEVNGILTKTFEKKIEKLKKSTNEVEREMATHLSEVFGGIKLDEEQFANKCMHTYKEDYTELHDKFTMFQTQNALEMDKIFDQENDNKCSIRGFKIRGTYAERKEAEARCKEVRELAEPVNVFVAPVGYWCPWDPSADAIQDSDYMIPQLNNLMGKYHENVKQKNQMFEERKKNNMDDATMSNKEKQKQRMRKKLQDKQRAEMEQSMRNERLKKEINSATAVALETATATTTTTDKVDHKTEDTKKDKKKTK